MARCLPPAVAPGRHPSRPRRVTRQVSRQVSMIGRSELTELLAAGDTAPCVSIYMPMERRFPEQALNQPLERVTDVGKLA